MKEHSVTSLLTLQTLIQLDDEEREQLLEEYTSDPLLADIVPESLSVEYLETMILVETGRAFSITLVKFTGETVSK
jgi:hypothetical protein